METVKLDPASEPVFCLSPYDSAYSEIYGTQAQLEAEGLIPEGLQWPAGYDDLRWTSGTFRFWLMRHRPLGAKGPRNLYRDADCWCLRWELKDGVARDREIAIRVVLLQKQLFDLSPQGQRDRAVLFNAHWKATCDARFQAFKASIPGLIKPKRGRRRATEILRTRP